MKKNIIISFLLVSYIGFSQNLGIGINATGTNPDPSAGLDIDFNNKGILIPRLTTIQRDGIQNPAVGLQIFNLDSDCIEAYFGTGQWKPVQCGCNTAPNQPIGITGNVDVCLNQTGVNYSVPSQSGVSFYTWWSSEPNDVINGQGTNNISVDFVGAGIRTLFVVANNSCGASDTTSLIVDSDNPDATFTPLIGSINQNVNFVAQLYVGATYSWTFNQGTPTTSTSQNPTVVWANAGMYAVSLTITDSVGCSSIVSDSVSILTCTSGSITFNYMGSTQQWTVPNNACLNATIEAWGAEGGTSTGQGGGQSYIGGLGAYVKGDFVITPGQNITVLVGQKGSNSNCGSGGGGGSFVVSNSNPMLIAGGGGGGFHCYALGGVNGIDGQSGNSGASGNCTPNRSPEAGGTNGNGGSAYLGGGGGGWLTNGTNSSSRGFAYPGQGGSVGGGYGGGGGYYNGCCGGSGGGGGYSGGSGGTSDGCAGGGGGSYNAGTNQTNTAGVQSGNGQVTITW